MEDLFGEPYEDERPYNLRPRPSGSGPTQPRRRQPIPSFAQLMMQQFIETFNNMPALQAQAAQPAVVEESRRSGWFHFRPPPTSAHRYNLRPRQQPAQVNLASMPRSRTASRHRRSRAPQASPPDQPAAPRERQEPVVESNDLPPLPSGLFELRDDDEHRPYDRRELEHRQIMTLFFGDPFAHTEHAARAAREQFAAIRRPELTPAEIEAQRRAYATKLAAALVDNSHCCAICLDRIRLKTLTVPCFHQYCHHCLFEWCKQKSFCPVCRAEIDKVLYNVESCHQYSECAAEIFAEGSYGFYWIDYTYDPDSGAYSRRFIHLTMIQMLASLFEKNPQLGTPIARLDYLTFKEAVTFRAEEELIPSYYRCFIYLHNYEPIISEANRTKQDISHATLSTSTHARRRLVQFLECELECLKKAFDIGLDSFQSSQLKSALGRSLQTVDMRSVEFTSLFCTNVEQKSRLKVAVKSYDIVKKLLKELILFAESPYEEHHAYTIAMSYKRGPRITPSFHPSQATAAAAAVPRAPEQQQPQQQQAQLPADVGRLAGADLHLDALNNYHLDELPIHSRGGGTPDYDYGRSALASVLEDD